MGVVRRNEPIATWEDGDFVQGFALLSRKDVRQDRNGRDYMDVEITDASGSVSGKIWPDSPAIKGQFVEKDFVTFKGTVRLYRDQTQLNIDYCRVARDERALGERMQRGVPAKLVFDHSVLEGGETDDCDYAAQLQYVRHELQERAQVRELFVHGDTQRLKGLFKENPALKQIPPVHRTEVRAT